MKINTMKKIRLFCISFLLILGSSLFAQKVKIIGTVEDALGALTGVSIVEKGTKSGTVTDANGKFSIMVSPEGELLLSYIGYEAQIVKINEKKTLRVLMKENTKNLDEVVVVGYGTMKKRDITGSITSIDSKEIEKSQVVNLAAALQGKVTGLDIMGSSEPGAGSSYRIRGTSTLSDGGSNPLFIVDGMETYNIDNINPRDIQSVEVLKDAASTAIYGSKSANGVIIITTKVGNSSKPKVSVSYSMKQSQIAHYLPQMNRSEGLRYEQLRSYLGGSSTITNRDSLNPAFTSDNYYQKLLYRTAYTPQVDASVSGADKSIRYFVSAGYADEQGIQLNTFNKRMTTRVNVDYIGTSKMTIGTRLALTVANQRQGAWSSRNSMLSRPAFYNLYEPDGTYTSYILGNSYNPIAATMLGATNYKNYDLNLNEFIEYQFLRDLKFRTSISASMYQSNSGTYTPAVLSTSNIASSTNSNSTRISWTQDNVLTYNKLFNKVHSVNIMGGFSLQKTTTDLTNLSVTNNITNSIATSNAYGGVTMNNTYSSWTGNCLASFYGRGSYSYKGRYLFNSNIRYDGSSRFGADKRWGLFPSVSAGWRISDERFMNWTKPALKDAKFRLSYGVTGNQSTGDFASLDVYSTNTYADYMGLSPSQLSNPDLGWETTKQLNGGLDLTFFDGRLNLVVDYYNKKTSDVLYSVKIPQTNGFSTSYRNVGNVDNNGFEFSIKTTNIHTIDFEWNTSLNLSFNKNIISSVPEGGQQILNNVYILDKGYAVGTMYGYKKLAVFAYDQSNAFTSDWKQLTPTFNSKGAFTGYQLDGQTYSGTVKQLRYSSSTGTVFKGGDVMWDDVNHDGVIDAKDRQVLGYGQPDVLGGFNTEFKYKNFTLSAFFSFALGGEVFNEYEYIRDCQIYSASKEPSPLYVANSWTAQGDVAKYPNCYNTALLGNTREASSMWVEDGSYIRLKNLRLGYDLPKGLMNKLHVSSVNVYVMLQNFFTWTNYSGYDPEFQSSGFSVGYDNNTYPKAKDILFGLNLNF